MTERLCLNCERILTSNTEIDKLHVTSNSFLNVIFLHTILVWCSALASALALASRSLASLTSLAKRGAAAVDSQGWVCLNVTM